jgi:DNA ligase D-like protein (predicted ligase)
MPTSRSALPVFVPLMLCQLVKEPFNSADWVFEPKLDGLRVLCRCNRDDIDLLSRNELHQEAQFPEIVDGLRKSVRNPALLDGEIVCLDENGRSSFRALQQRFHISDAGIVARRVKLYPAYLYVFDILFFDGDDVRGQPLSKRKKLLRRAVRWNGTIRFTPMTPEKGIPMLREACRNGEEGIVAKRTDSSYRGDRSGAWLKIKCSGRQEFVIGGFTDPQKSRVGLGALLVGYYDDDGSFYYAGKVGTGFTNELLHDLRKRLDPLVQQQNPFTSGKRPPAIRSHWVKPTLVCEIEYSEWTQHGQLRHPRFEGLRRDKKARDVRREKPKSLAQLARPLAAGSRRKRRG